MNTDNEIYIGLDIGGTRCRAASADLRGTVIKRIQGATPAGLDEGLDLLHKMIAEAAGDRSIKAIGAAIGGPLDHVQGVVSPLHQPAWRNVGLKALMTEKYGCDFHVDVDTNVAALGEWKYGGEKASRFLYLTLSTGMGGGFLIDGNIYRGAGGGHPEVGHHSIACKCTYPERVSCECGGTDCLEALISGNGIRRIYGRPAEELCPDEWNEVACNLGQGLRNLTAIYLPDVIALGGGVAIGGGEKLLKTAVETMKQNLFILKPPEVRLSRLGKDTPLLGAIALAMQSRDRSK